MPTGAVTVGGLVINLAAETSQLKVDMAEGARTVETSAKAMINSMTGVTESTGRATDAGSRMVRQLQEEIATFGMSSQELTRYKANLNGVGGEVDALMQRLNAMKAAQAGYTDQLAASEAQATQRIKEMVAASMAEVNALNDVASATQAVTNAQAAAASTGRSLAETQRLQILNMQGVAASMRAVQDGTVAMSADTQRILAQYDPLGAKLRALQADLATLRKEMGNSVDPAAIKAFQGLEDEIAKTQRLMAQAAAQANALGGSTSQLTLTQTQLIDRFKQQADTIGMSRSQLMAYQAAQAGVTQQTKDAIATVKAHEDALKAAAKAKEEERNATQRLNDGLKLLAAGYAALKVGEYIKDATMLAARYETLDVVMGVVGRTAGYTKTQMDAAAQAVAKQGITLTESRNNVIKLVQAHVDLSNATALARIAQDAAVIGNINSSEAFERLVNGVARGNVLILRNIGINVNLQTAYQQMAASLGKSTLALTENERVQARLNAVLERGTDIAGTYEAAMDTASKQITSMKRYSEDLKTTLGSVFTETLTIGVMALTEGLKDANGEVSELAKNNQLAEWGHDATGVFVSLANTVDNVWIGMRRIALSIQHDMNLDQIKKRFAAQLKQQDDRTATQKFFAQSTPTTDRVAAEKNIAIGLENADYEKKVAELGSSVDRFQRAADERMAARLAKQKKDAEDRLKVDQDYAARAQALLIANAGKSVEIQQAAQAKLAKEVYQGTPTYRDSGERPEKPKVDQADNTRLQDHLARIEKEAAAEKQNTEFQMKLDEMRHKAGEMLDDEYYARRRESIGVLALIDADMYNKELAALRGHHNSTQAEEAKNQKAIHDIIDKQTAAGNKAFYDQQTDEEEARLRTKKLYDDAVKATLGVSATNIKSLDDEIEKQRQHNAEIGKTKEQVELTKQAQVDLRTAQMQSDADYLRDGLAKWELDDQARALYGIRLTNLDEEIARRRTLSGLLADGSTAEAGAAAMKELDKYLDPTKAEKFGNSLKGALGGAARSMEDLTSAMTKYGTLQESNDKARVQAQVLLKGSDKDRAKGLEALEEINRRSTVAQLNGYGNMVGAAKGFFNESSKGYKTLAGIEQAFRAAELALAIETTAKKIFAKEAEVAANTTLNATKLSGEAATSAASTGLAATEASAWGITAVVKAIASMPFPLNLAAGAATLAAVVAIGAKMMGGVGGSSISLSQQRQQEQGTGSVLGDRSAKSESIKRAIDLTAANSSTQINYLSAMTTALRNIENNIGSFASLLVRSTDLSGSGVKLNTNNGGATTALGLGVTAGGAAVGYAAGAGLTAFTAAGAVGGPIGMIAGAVLGYLASKSSFVGKIATSIFGGKQTVEDAGITMSPAALASILSSGAKVSQYTAVKTSGGWFRGDDHDVIPTALSADANNQITAVIKSLSDSVKAAGDLMGISGDDFTAKLNSFVVDIGKVSLKDLKGDELQKALESVFSKLGDDIARYAIGGLEGFQKVGEGYLETLVRVATDYAKVDASLTSIGMAFGATGLQSIAARESLIELVGGIDELQSKTASFAENFLTQAERLAPVQKYVSDELAKLNLGWVDTRDEFKQVVLGLDLTTAAGRSTYAALMGLSEAFAVTHEAIKDTTKSAQDIADERKDLRDQLDELTMSPDDLLKKQRAAIDDSNKSLFDQVQAAKDAAAALETHNSLLDLQGQIAELTGDKAGAAAVLEQQHAIALAALDPALRGATQNLWDLQAAAKAAEAVKANASTLLGGVDSAFSVLQKVVDREKKAVQTTIDAHTEAVSKLQSLSQSLHSTLDSLRSPDQKLLERTVGQAQIRAALAIARAGGPLPDSDSLKDALSAVQQDASGQFETYNDYLRDLYQTQSDIGALAGLTDDSLSVEEKALDAAQKQLEALDGALVAAQQQIDVLKGIDANGVSLLGAIEALGSSILAAQANSVVAAGSAVNSAYQQYLGRGPDQAGLDWWKNQAASGVSVDAIKDAIKNSPEAQVQRLYQDLLGRSADAGGLAFFLKSGSSMSDIAAAIKGSDEYQKLHIPGFAGGGLHGGGLRIVGENGPELEATGPSRIWSSSQTAAILSRAGSGSGIDVSQLAGEMQELRRENAMLRQVVQDGLRAIAEHTSNTASHLDDVVNGRKPIPTEVVQQEEYQ